MPSLRRTEHAFFTLEDDYVLDPVSLLRGIMPKPAAKARIVALAALTGERHSIDQRAWEALVSIPIDGWVDEDRFDTKVVRGLLEKGLIVSDSSDTALTDLRERDKALTAAAWHPDAALYHFATQWSGSTSVMATAGTPSWRRKLRLPFRISSPSMDPHPPSSRT